jgi:hypothetical protein
MAQPAITRITFISALQPLSCCSPLLVAAVAILCPPRFPRCALPNQNIRTRKNLVGLFVESSG